MFQHMTGCGAAVNEGSDLSDSAQELGYSGQLQGLLASDVEGVSVTPDM